jgi:hypothetical protein
MQIAQHLYKIEKLERLREGLDPQRDFELWFWATMTAGTNAVNAALHQVGATVAEDGYAMQPGLYLVPANGGLEPAFRPLGDVLHVGRPAVEAPVPLDITAMMAAMERIEHHRDPCIREGRVVDQAVVRDCEEAFADCLTRLGKLMEARHDA